MTFGEGLNELSSKEQFSAWRIEATWWAMRHGEILDLLKLEPDDADVILRWNALTPAAKTNAGLIATKLAACIAMKVSHAELKHIFETEFVRLPRNTPEQICKALQRAMSILGEACVV